MIVPVSNKSTLYLYLIATLEIGGQSVLCFIVTLVRRTHYIFTTLLRSDLQLIVSDKRALYLYFIASLVTIARSVLYLIATLVISTYYICTSLQD